MIIIDGVLNIIGNNKHFIWNKEMKQFEKFHDFDGYQHFEGHPIIHLKSKNCLLIFGGDSGDIHYFSLLNKIWSKLAVTMPKRLRHFGSISYYLEENNV